MAVNQRGDGSLRMDKELQAPKLTRIAELISDHMVDIYVGTERKKFRLHRDLLCDRSDYLRAYFMGSIEEAKDNEIFLPEDDVESFKLFVDWLYGAPLQNISADHDTPEKPYIGLVFLARKLCLEHLQNEAMNHILEFHRTNPDSIGYQLLYHIYQNTSDQDHIRSYWVALAAYVIACKQVAALTADDQRLIWGGGDIAVDFTHWLSIFYAGSRGDRELIAKMDPRKVPFCSYHKHDSTPLCSEPST